MGLFGIEIPSVESLAEEATNQAQSAVETAGNQALAQAENAAQGALVGAVDSAMATSGLGAFSSLIKGALGNGKLLGSIGVSRFPAKPPRQG